MPAEDMPDWARVLIDVAPEFTSEQVDAIRPAFAQHPDAHAVNARQREDEHRESSAA